MTYVSPPLELPVTADEDITRVDLQVFGIEHRDASFEVRIFLDTPEADRSIARDAEHGYAGSFYIFGHGGCVGDSLHCHVPEEPPHRYDIRPSHKLTPQTRVVNITAAWRRLQQGTRETATATVTLVPVNAVEPEGIRREDAADLLVLSRIAVVAYA